MKIKRLLGLSLAIVLVTAALSTATGSPAFAANNCSAGNWCIWTSQNFTGLKVTFNPPAHVGDCVNFVYPYDDNASSAANAIQVGTSPSLVLWSGYNCTGAHKTISPRTAYASLITPAGFDNTASSLSR